MPERPTRKMREMTLDELLMIYFNWRARQIPPRPRACHLSAELNASPKATEHRKALDELIGKIEAGQDLTPHLSEKVGTAHDPDFPAKKMHQRDDRDLLLADWGVYHLHLAVSGSDDLVFAMVTPTDAYLIGVYPHGSWGLTEILEIVVRNWPDAGLMLPTHAIGLTNKWTDEERLELREAGISSPMIELDGKVWASSAMGQTADGKTSMATIRSNEIMHTLYRWETDQATLLAEAEQAVNRAGERTVTGNWTPVVHGQLLGLQRDDVFHPIASLADHG